MTHTVDSNDYSTIIVLGLISVKAQYDAFDKCLICDCTICGMTRQESSAMCLLCKRVTIIVGSCELSYYCTGKTECNCYSMTECSFYHTML